MIGNLLFVSGSCMCVWCCMAFCLFGVLGYCFVSLALHLLFDWLVALGWLFVIFLMALLVCLLVVVLVLVSGFACW